MPHAHGKRLTERGGPDKCHHGDAHRKRRPGGMSELGGSPAGIGRADAEVRADEGEARERGKMENGSVEICG